ncbi:hypothetical protein SK128_022108 [Halocaridina rubra]|uniref:WAP domain-containing protein n=1 Tax=Halocaridina rubra TaxID=373956 RepID=A0AAN9A583_HALRR
MKNLKVIIIGCMVASALGQETTTESSDDSETPQQGNTRIFGGLLNSLGLGGLNPGPGGSGSNGGFGSFFGGGFNPGLGFGVGISQTCRYWCRTPQGQAYCCETNDQAQGPVGVKPGFCPPVRPQCPPVRSFAPPQTCSNDYSCVNIDKCCFDTCLQEHVCKPPIGSSSGFGFGGGFGSGFPAGFGR